MDSRVLGIKLNRVAWWMVAVGFVLGWQAEASGQRPRGRTRDDVLNNAFKVRDSHLTHLELDVPRGKPFQAVVPIEGQPVTLDLRPHSVKAPGYRVLVQQPDGSMAPAPPGQGRTYRGHAAGIEGSAVAATLDAHGLSARILLPGGDEYWIEPVAPKLPAAAGTHIVYREDDVLAGEICGTDAVLHTGGPGPGPAHRSASSGACGTGMCVAELAADADVEFFNAFGSVAAVEDRIQSIVNALNIQYERDVQTTHQITTIIVRTAEPDAYDSTDSSGLLYEFRDHWQANHQNIHRDVAHLFTGKNLDGSIIGVAWLNAVCGGYGYGLSQSNFTANFAYVTDLSAHELGHNWGGNHCSCSAYTMNPSITGTNRFHATESIPEISAFRDSRACLEGISTCVDDLECDDGLFCNGAETCDAALGCLAGADPCPGQSCDESADLCADCFDDFDCDDGLFCNGPEVCLAAGCDPGLPVNCDDGTACTDDSCNETTDSCDHIANDGLCEDGLFCNGAEMCDPDLGCLPGAPVDCDDGLVCTADSCNEGADACNHVADDAGCDDGVFCNGQEFCGSNGCQPGPDPCPGEVCEELTGTCVPSPCNSDGSCDAGEDCENCPGDCPASSGAACGNGRCEPASGEDCLSCPGDCNGKQNGNPARRFCCGDGTGVNPVGCGDPRCTSAGFSCTAGLPTGFCCGNGVCEAQEECVCPTDCGSPPLAEIACADGVDDDCDGHADCADDDCSADPACPQGPACGDGICEGNGEDCFSCPDDCRCKGRNCARGCCGDGICYRENAGNCPADCGG